MVKISEVHFDVNKKGVRDRRRNLLKKQKKMRREEGEFGSSEEDTELDDLLQNITEKWNEASASHDCQSKQKLKKIETEKSNTEDERQQAMETFAETRKRK